jgi:hypothetical protein
MSDSNLPCARNRSPIEADNLDDGLRALLQAHRAIFPIIKNNKTTSYKQGHSRSGLSLPEGPATLLHGSFSSPQRLMFISFSVIRW